MAGLSLVALVVFSPSCFQCFLLLCGSFFVPSLRCCLLYWRSFSANSYLLSGHICIWNSLNKCIRLLMLTLGLQCPSSSRHLNLSYLLMNRVSWSSSCRRCLFGWFSSLVNAFLALVVITSFSCHCRSYPVVFVALPHSTKAYTGIGSTTTLMSVNLCTRPSLHFPLIRRYNFVLAVIAFLLISWRAS